MQNCNWITWKIDKKLWKIHNSYWISWKIAPKAWNMPSQDVRKFTPVSYRTSALWGCCPAPTPLLQLITPSRASGTAGHVRSLDDLLTRAHWQTYRHNFCVRHMDPRTHGPTHKTSYKVASPRLKRYIDTKTHSSLILHDYSRFIAERAGALQFIVNRLAWLFAMVDMQVVMSS